MENYKLPGFGQLWDETWAIYKERRAKLLILSIPLLLVQLFSFVLLNNYFNWYAIGASLVLGVLVFMFSQAAFFGNLAHNNESFEVALHESPKYLWTTVLQSLVVLCGFVLLIVPGIIWSLWLMLFPAVIADHKVSGLEALARSREYMSGNVLTVLVKFFVFSLIVGIPGNILEAAGQKSEIFGLISVLYGVFAMQVMAVYLYNIYAHIKANKPEIKPDRNWLRNTAIGGAIVAVAVVAVLGVLYYKFHPEILEAIQDRNGSPMEWDLSEPEGAEEGL